MKKLLLILCLLGLNYNNLFPDILNVKFSIPGVTCVNKKVHFIDESTTDKTIVKWFWKFGDGDTSDMQHPTHQYKGFGDYKITLIVKLNTGSTDSFSTVKHIKSAGYAWFHAATPSPSCSNFVEVSPMDFSGRKLKTKWKYDDTTIDHNAFDEKIRLNFKKQGVHAITMMLLDTNGCNDTFTVNYTTLPTIKYDFGFSPLKPCILEEVKFQAKLDTLMDSISYEWHFGDGADTNDDSITTHTYSNLSTKSHLVTLELKHKGENVCPKFVYHTVTVYERPHTKRITYDSVNIAGKKYFRAAPSYDGIKRNIEWGVKYYWTVYNALGDSVKYDDTPYVYIPDTFTTPTGINIKLKAIGSSCTSVYKEYHFNGVKKQLIRAFHDFNKNRIMDAGDTLLNNVMVILNNIEGNTFVMIDSKEGRKFNWFGKDTFFVHSYYKTDRFKKIYYQDPSKVLRQVILGGKSSDTFDFPMWCDDKMNDLSVETIFGGRNLVRGNEHTFYIYLSNQGSKMQRSINLMVGFAPQLTNFNSSQNFTTVPGKTNYRKLLIDSLEACADTILSFKLKVNPDSNILNVWRKVWAYLDNWQDSVAENNEDTLNLRVGTPYDPNIKTGYPEGVIDYGVKELDYTIQFENEGNAPAQEVVLRDTLDPRFDLATFEFVASKHKGCQVSLEDNRVLTFTFRDIQLPYKQVGSDASIGWVKFKIKLKDPLGDKQTLKNRAGIYFDYEKVVNTPWAVLERNDQYAVVTRYNQNDEINVYPNPSANSFTINFSGILPGKLYCFDVNGKQVLEYKVQTSQQIIATDHLPEGCYILMTDDGRTVKWIKSKY